MNSYTDDERELLPGLHTSPRKFKSRNVFPPLPPKIGKFHFEQFQKSIFLYSLLYLVQLPCISLLTKRF